MTAFKHRDERLDQERIDLGLAGFFCGVITGAALATLAVFVL